MCVDRVQNHLNLVAHNSDRRLAVVSNTGYMKQKVYTAYIPSGKPGTLEALECCV